MKTKMMKFVLVTGLTLAASKAVLGDVLYSNDFESITPGAGVLSTGAGDSPFQSFSLLYTAGSLSGTANNDPIQGVTSYNGSQVGYLGGAGTNLTVDAPGRGVIVQLFSGVGTPINYGAQAQSTLGFSSNFSVLRNGGTNNQEFKFEFFDAGAIGDYSDIAYHSYVIIGADNKVYIQDYYNVATEAGSPWIDTGVSITSGDAYSLSITVDYAAKTWAAGLQDNTNSLSYDLAEGRTLDFGAAYTLSGYTSGASVFDLDMAAVVGPGDYALSDRLVFDNLTVVSSVSAVPEPSTYAAIVGAVALAGTCVRRLRKKRL